MTSMYNLLELLRVARHKEACPGAASGYVCDSLSNTRLLRVLKSVPEKPRYVECKG